MGRLWDFRDADLSKLNTRAVKRLAKHPLQFPPGINEVYVAFVTGRDLEFSMARMFESYSSDAETKIMVFRDLEEAEA